MILEENTEKKQSHIEKLETTIRSLSSELLKVCLNIPLALSVCPLGVSYFENKPFFFNRLMKLSRSYKEI